MEQQPYTFAIGETDQGKFVAVSTTEPLFCIVCDTQEEALVVAEDSIRSYVKHFLGAQQVVGRAEPVPVHRFNVRESRALMVA